MEEVMRLLLIFLFMLPAFAVVKAGIHTEMVTYKQGDAVLEGFLAYDDAIAGKRPGVLVIHAWRGLGEYEKMRATKLAELGYVAFALDMYGKGVRPKTSEEAAAQATIYRSERALMRARAQAGLDQLKGNDFVDISKTAAIGYCFGGGAALELARSGADLDGVVSFHGNLDTPNPADAQNIKAEILVCAGGSDPHVPATQREAFQKEMTDADVNWQMNIYGGAVHSFTDPAAGNNPSTGSAYNKQADMRSWRAMQDFFNEIFK